MAAQVDVAPRSQQKNEPFVMTETPFWETKTLSEMTDTEWESLCDGCGKCCLVLLSDEETGEVWETDVSCRLFDSETRRCTNYQNRLALVKGCVQLTPENANALDWMPDSCAYRRLAAGKPLPDWHPLISGERSSTVRAGIAVSASLHNEVDIAEDDLEDHIVRQRKGPSGDPQSG